MGSQREVLLIGMCVILFNCANGFNISPKPNYVFQEPDLKTFMPKTQSSYFGYSINLRPSR